MKRIKKIIILLIFIIVLVPCTKVFAADCDSVRDAKLDLETLEAEYEQKDCANTADAGVLSECNEIVVAKSAVLEKLFKYNADKVCPEIDLSSIIEKYEDDCSNEFSSEVQEIADVVMKVFFVTAPFMLILFGSLDFFKVVAGNDPKEIQKSRTNFIKRVVAFFLLYLAPVVVRWLFSLTPYDMNGTTYICAQEIDLNPKITATSVKGTYNGYKNTKKGKKRSGSGSSATGDAIAAAAKEVKEDASDNGYTWGCNYLGAEYQGTSTTDHMCCAELLGAALYRAEIYDLDTVNSTYQTASAPGLGNILNAQGWILIEDEDDLQPGDVLFYEKLEDADSAGIVYLNGEEIHTCHTDIYYGDGQKVNTGGGFSQVFHTFSVDTTCYSVSSRWRFAFRYPGD